MKNPRGGRTPKNKIRHRAMTKGGSDFAPNQDDLEMAVADQQTSTPKNAQTKPWNSFFLSDELPASDDFNRGDQGFPQERESFD